jgi:hypothetical protein
MIGISETNDAAPCQAIKENISTSGLLVFLGGPGRNRTRSKDVTSYWMFLAFITSLTKGSILFAYNWQPVTVMCPGRPG